MYAENESGPGAVARLRELLDLAKRGEAACGAASIATRQDARCGSSVYACMLSQHPWLKLATMLAAAAGRQCNNSAPSTHS